MRHNFRRLVAISLMITATSAVALFLSILLGKAYLGVLKSEGPKSPPKPKISTPVTSASKMISQELTPVPVFYLQGGVYSDLDSAQVAATEFLNLGFDPYITSESPFRIYVGFFGSREDALKLKTFLADREISSFTQMQMLNSKAITYNVGKKELFDNWIPYFRKYSTWIAGTGRIYNFGVFEQVNVEEFRQKLPGTTLELEKINTEARQALSQLKDKEAAEILTVLIDASLTVEDRLKKLQSGWTRDAYNQVGKSLIYFVHTYSESSDKLAQSGKT